MKRTAFLSPVLLGLLLGLGPGFVVCSPVCPGAPFEVPVPVDRTASAPRLLLSDRVETGERIIYGTDPEMERAMDEQIQEEKEKEEKAWKMLQQMNVSKEEKKRRRHDPPEKTQPK
jgi:hypothetical protein